MRFSAMWPQLRKNRLQVVTPSAIAPLLRQEKEKTLKKEKTPAQPRRRRHPRRLPALLCPHAAPTPPSQESGPPRQKHRRLRRRKRRGPCRFESKQSAVKHEHESLGLLALKIASMFHGQVAAEPDPAARHQVPLPAAVPVEAAAASSEAKPAPPVLITVSGDNIVIASEDCAAP